MSPAPKRPRTTKRERQRHVKKLAHKLDQLTQESPGGSPERAIAVTSASVVEIKARTTRCGRCEGELELRGHQATFHAGAQLRCVELICKQCFHPRTLWFCVKPAAN